MITERCAPTLSSPPPFQLLPLPTTTSRARDDPPVCLRDGKQVLMNLPRKHHHTISTLSWRMPKAHWVCPILTSQFPTKIWLILLHPLSSSYLLKDLSPFSLLFRLLFLSVHWARRLPVFRSLPYSTQVGINFTGLSMYVHITCHSICIKRAIHQRPKDHFQQICGFPWCHYFSA